MMSKRVNTYGLALLLLLSGCRLSTDEVPIHDPTMPADADVVIPADAGPVDAGPLHDDGGDSGPRGDSAVEDATVEFADDFNRTDGKPGFPWDSRWGDTQIWDGRLCMTGNFLDVELEDAPYGFFRVAIPAAASFTISGRASSSGSELFGVTFEADGTLVSHEGDELGRYEPYSVTLLTVQLDYSARRARVGINGERFTDVDFSAYSADQRLGSIYFQRVGAQTPACIDDFYVGPSQADDPFGKPFAVNACVPQPDLASRCIAAHCCDSLARTSRELSDIECKAPGCPPLNVALCAAKCVQEHPSGTLSTCTHACRQQLTTDSATFLLKCVDEYCAEAPEEPVVTHEPFSWETDGEPMGDRLWMRARPPALDPQELGNLGISRWYSIDVPDDHVHLGLPFVSGERIELFAEPSDTRAVIVLGDDPWRNNRLTNRLYTWDRTKNDVVAFARELAEPILWVVPSPSRRYVWVQTGEYSSKVRSHTLLTVDGRILLRGAASDTPYSPPWYGPDESYAVLVNETDVVILDLATLAQHTFKKADAGVGLAEPQWLFSDSVAWRTLNGEAWRRLDFKGEAVAESLPDGLQAQGPFGAASGGLFVANKDGPKRIATLPSDWQQAAWKAVAADDEHVLMHNAGSLAVFSSNGAMLAKHDLNAPGTPASEERQVQEVYPFGPNHGLLLVRQVNLPYDESVFAFSLDNTVIDLVTVVSQQSILDVLEILRRPDSSSFLVVTQQAVHLFDVVTGEHASEAHTTVESELLYSLSWGRYEPPPVYRPTWP